MKSGDRPNLENQSDPDESIRNPALISFEILSTHVTSIKIIDNEILAGIGDHLRVFTRKGNSTWTNSFSVKVFSGQCIHGIELNNDRGIIVFGGKSVSILRYDLLPKSSKLCINSTFSVQDWILDCISISKGTRAIFLTANNLVLFYDVSSDCPRVVDEKVSTVRCILYSGKLLNTTSNGIIVLAGTVFSTIIVWSTAGIDREKEVIHELKSHSGVIFCIECCSKSRRICSTSDDRSVRIWDVEFDNPDQEDWNRSRVTVKYAVYGHSARVWKCKFVGDGRFVSVGEDSLICLWNTDGSLCNQWSGHQNGEIWSLDTTVEHRSIVTGGGDGGISLWPLRKEILPYPLIFGDNLSSESPRCVGLLGSGCPFLVTMEGDIFLARQQKWKFCFSESSLKSYCIRSVSPDKNYVAFGSITGSIFVCRLENENLSKVIETVVSKGRIYNLIWLSNDSLIISELDGMLTIWSFSVRCSSLSKVVDFILPPSKERWITSGAANEDYVVCGDRAGSLFLYSKHGCIQNPIFIAKKVHGSQGVTCVKFLNDKILSTGRDGKYREFLIVNKELLTVTCSKLRLDWAAAILDYPCLRKILICFHDKFLILWSVEQRRPVLKIDCGGGHRSWDYLVDTSSGIIYVTYIKGKSIFICDIPILDVSCQTVLPGCTPKAINAAAILPVTLKTSRSNLIEGATQYLLLGSEDTTLRLNKVLGQSLSELSVLQNHLSSVRAVQCCETIDTGEVIIASAGGRGQLIIWKLFSLDDSVEIILLDSYNIMEKSSSKSGDVSVMDDAEMRVMCIQIRQSRGRLLIAAGCSDGLMRLFSFDLDAKRVTFLEALKTEYCFLDLKFIELRSTLYVLSTGTGGLISLHLIDNSRSDHEWQVTNHRISDCGINSCDYTVVGDQLLVLTGGDDACLNAMFFANEDEIWTIKDCWKTDNAHSCQISGVKIADSWFMSVGLDKRMSVYSWSLSNSSINTVIIKYVDLSIPDIHGLLVWQKFGSSSYNVFVYGQGVQLLEFSPCGLSD